MYRRSFVEIDVARIKENVRRLRGWNGANFFCPMVKANGYGHGDVTVARAVAEVGADAVGVALVEEGVRLREAGLTIPILVFASFDGEAAAGCEAHGLTPVIGRPEHLAAFRGRALDVHLKINTGMQRLGFDAAELAGVKASLGALRVRGVATHLTHGEDAADARGPSAVQLTRFRELSQGLPGVRHAHKSASLAALGDAIAAGDVGSRPGIAIYGLPHEGPLVGEGLRPALTWRSELVAVHRLRRGDPVGYGARFVAPEDLWLGVVPIGYADGYARLNGGRGFVVVGGARRPVVGSVCMDYSFVHLGDLAVGVGEPVWLIGGGGGGAQVSAYDLAVWRDTISYEVVTSISSRVPRRTV